MKSATRGGRFFLVLHAFNFRQCFLSSLLVQHVGKAAENVDAVIIAYALHRHFGTLWLASELNPGARNGSWCCCRSWNMFFSKLVLWLHLGWSDILHRFIFALSSPFSQRDTCLFITRMLFLEQAWQEAVFDISFYLRQALASGSPWLRGQTKCMDMNRTIAHKEANLLCGIIT